MDLPNFRSAINGYENELWIFDQYTRRLQDERFRASTLFNDSGAKALNQRYFNPHAEESKSSITQLKLQYDCVCGIRDQLSELSILKDSVFEHTEENKKILTRSSKEIEHSIFTEELSKKANKQTVNAINRARQILDELTAYK